MKVLEKPFSNVPIKFTKIKIKLKSFENKHIII